MRALGLETDSDIVTAVSLDEDILTYMMQNLEAAECSTVDEGVMYVGKKLAPNQTKEYQRNGPSLCLITISSPT